MYGSKNDFFKQDKETLRSSRIKVKTYLQIKGYLNCQIEVYTTAYDYFTKHPNQFDGATGVNDLEDIPGLSLKAMLHDYHYIVLHVCCEYKYTIISALLYGHQIERMGAGKYHRIVRASGLIISSPYYVNKFRKIRSRMTNDQKEDFLDQYGILVGIKPKPVF